MAILFVVLRLVILCEYMYVCVCVILSYKLLTNVQSDKFLYKIPTENFFVGCFVGRVYVPRSIFSLQDRFSSKIVV